MSRMLDFYLTTMKTAVIVQFQYRISNYFYMVGVIAEPLIYLVVWSTIANQSGGQVAGFTAGSFAAYYIVWTLVRNMNIVFTPYGWEFRIKDGELSGMLLRPLHPIHYDLAYFAGWKFIVILLWLPIAAILTLIFHPIYHFTPLGLGIAFIAIWNAFIIRMIFLWSLGMISFWTTRVSAIYELYFALELLLSGRLVPLAILPAWAQHVANFFPFQWTFGYPIEAIIGSLSTHDLISGLIIQFIWITVGALILQYLWKFAVRHYTAVGN